MAIRVFGFRSISSRGSTTLGAPTGNIFLNSTGTNITGNASVAGYVYALGSGTFLRNFFVGGYSTLTDYVRILSTISSISSNTGALVVTGGVGIGSNANVGGFLHVYNTLTTSTYLISGTYNVTTSGDISLLVDGGTIIRKDLLVGNTTHIYSTATSTSTNTGALIVDGGVGIGKDLNVGNITHIYSTATSILTTSSSSGALIVDGGVAISKNLNVGDVTHIYSIATSTSTNTGALIVDGGVGIGKDLNVGNITHIYSTVTSTSTNTGALIVDGGVGIGKDLNVGQNATITGTIQVVGNTSTVIIKRNDDNVNNPYNHLYTTTDVYGTIDQRTAGAVYVGGGVGIEKDLNVGGYIYGRIFSLGTSTEIVATATNIDSNFYLSFVNPVLVNSGTYVYFDKVSTLTNTGGLTYNPYTGKISTEQLYVASSQTSTSTITGAFTVTGGVGIGGDVYIGGAEYVDQIYTKIISSTRGPIQIDPEAQLTEIFGDIRVRGTNPIGTAPVVTNTLYVTVDGNDVNDGRAMDSSRACRTVGGAMKSPYYQPGTQILVSAGFYLEDNPLEMKPYTSVRGSDIRTTFIEPINKTQDLFHVNSGCYLNYMTFLNGRSGLLEGPYDNGYNRGAYATAFPPLSGDKRIDLFHSPYIQNCTNQSGPWLRDGTMFIPNSTVQIPSGVATGSWPKGTTSITVNVTTGTISIGDYINAGQAHPGFFNARTLMLANKPFLQEQVVKYVDNTFNSGSFTYDQTKCRRDIGLIVDSIAIDLLQDSTSESIFAGLQYWRQSGYVDDVGNQISQTKNAIANVQTRSQSAVSAYATEQAIVGSRFNDILTILNTLTSFPSSLSTGVFSEWVSNYIVSNGLSTTTVSTVAAYNALISAKPGIVTAVITDINSSLSPFAGTYNKPKYLLDIGLVVDSVAQDLLFDGYSQSVFTGLRYWNQSGYVSTIASGISTLTNTINYVRSLAQKIVVNDTSGARYQSTITQVTNLTSATINEATTVGLNFSTITNILVGGTVGVSTIIVPNGLEISTLTNVVNAYSLLRANLNYIRAEAVAFVETTKTAGFVYDQTKYSRDVGYIVDNVSFDLLYGGNKQSVESGVYYYNFNGADTVLDDTGTNETPQTIVAYEYIKKLLASIIASKPIPTANLYQTVVPQVLGNPGTTSEIQDSNKRIDVILDILTNGPSKAPEKTAIGVARSTDSYVINSAKLLNLNRNFIQSEVVAYVDTLKTFIYDETLCRRDIGFMIDSVAFDLLHGGNKQSVKSGVYYYGYTSTVTEITNEIPQTTAAYRYIKSIIPNIVKSTPLINAYQKSTAQVVNLNSATDYEANMLSDKIDIITNIIRNGPAEYSAPGKRIPIRLVTNTSSNYLNAYNLLKANLNFIKEETIAFINSTTNFFNYNRAKCFRDVGILVENISYDAAFGGNQKAVESGLSYYDGVISKIAGQEGQTVAAIDYLSQLTQQIITNTTATDLFSTGTTTTATYKQVINWVLTGGDISGKSFNQLFDTVTTIIDNGPTAAPDVYTSTGPDAAFISAETLMQANRTFIQQDTINWINNTFLSFPYSEVKCRRDTGLIVDAIAQDLLYPTPGHSQSTFAGLQYWGQNQADYVGDIKVQLGPTLSAMTYLKALAVKIIQNITPAVDLINRYQTLTPQVTSLDPATVSEVALIISNFNIILEIFNGNVLGWTDRIVSNGSASDLSGIKNAFALLQANKKYMADEVVAYTNSTNFGFVYDQVKFAQDLGRIIDSISFDLLHGGNRQSVQAGLYYYKFDGSATNIRNQIVQTTAAFDYLSTITSQVILGQPIVSRQSLVKQNFNVTTATMAEAIEIAKSIFTITNIINSGTSVAAAPSSIAMTASNTASIINAYNAIYANKQFLVEEVIAYIDQTYNPNSFNYNEEKCYRDVGLLIDAVSQDIVLGGNSKSIEAGKGYWSAGYNYVDGQVTTTTAAINYARDIALKIIANEPVTPQTGTVLTQIINTFFQYGGDYMPQQAVKRNFNIITTIIENGPSFSPPVYAGSGLFSLVGTNGSDVKIAPTVVSIDRLYDGRLKLGLDTPTIGFGNNATLYFGDVLIFPKRDIEVDKLSFQYSGNTGTWAQRKIDPIGGMGGSLVDGGVISDRSPIQSFVYDAFTQLTQGGRGVHIINNGYAQLVSVFTIFSSIGVEVETGGIASIVNSNANFGNICLQAKGFGDRKFTGHIYNPYFKSYPESPNIPGSDYFNQYYPNGFWPNNGRVMVFLPELDDRPHISLVMEIIPPETVKDFSGNLLPQRNEQGFPGFLNASPTTSTLTTGSITINEINTDGIAIGNSVYVRDQFGFSTSTNVDSKGNWVPYIATGTVVIDIGYRSVTLNFPLKSGGADPGNKPDSVNENFFDLYFCGNAYYTVLSSEIGYNPKYNRQNQLIPAGINILSTQSTGLSVSQIPSHLAAIRYLNTLTNRIISNIKVTSLQTVNTTTIQTTNLLLNEGSQAITFIDLRFQEMLNIIGAPSLSAAENIIPPSLRDTTGQPVQGAGSAVELITENIEFMADEISKFVEINYFTTTFGSFSADEKEFIKVKCQRDVKIILQRLVYDINSGGRYNSVLVGLSYWARQGSYHIVQLGENVTRTDLFPDGATVNFYQRSYISASGYVFEYVGAGIDYGALPQRGIADPAQGREVVQLGGGKVFFTSTDQNGDFRIGPGLVISQATGVLSGRTFTKSLFANMTPFILAIEAGF